MMVRAFNIGHRQSSALLLLLAALSSIPLLVPVFYEKQGATSVWPSYYVGGAMVAQGLGSQLYDAAVQTSVWNALPNLGKDPLPFIAPPYVAAFLEPLGALPYVQSTWLWAIINFVLVTLTLCALNRELVRRTSLNPFRLDLGVVLFLPTLTVIVIQQTSLILVLALLMAWSCFKKGQEGAAGAWLSLLFLKPHLIGLPILVLVFKKRMRALIPLALVAAMLTLISFLLMGSAGFEAYLKLVSSYSGWAYNPDIRWPVMTTSWAGLLQFWLVSETTNLPLTALLLWLLGAAVSIGLLLKAWKGPWAPRSIHFDLQWGLLVALTIFTTLHAYAYELVLLIPPFALVFAQLAGRDNVAYRWLVDTIRYSLLIVPACVLIAFLLNVQFLPLLLGLGSFLLARQLIQEGEASAVTA